MAQEITAYCSNEGMKRTFTKIGGSEIVGKYQCNGCQEVYSEPNLTHPDGTGGDLVDLLISKGDLF